MRDDLQRREFGKAYAALLNTRQPLMSRSYLLATGVGLKVVGGKQTDEPCVKVFVPRKIPIDQLPSGQVVPTSVSSSEGTVRTDVEEMRPPTSPPRLLDFGWESEPFWFGNVARHRPVRGGDSVSHVLVPLGTVAAEVNDPLLPGRLYILSCNHVLAALNRAALGDPVVQPATSDGGRAPAATCGVVDRWVPILFGAQGANLVDAAVAQVRPGEALPTVEWLGTPTGVRSGNSLKPGDKVLKVGRTTLLNYGTVVAVEVSGWIAYPLFLGGSGFPAFFERQIVTTAMAGFGDSGSLLFDTERNAVGLLFGGSPTHTFYNDITNVQDALRIRIALR